MIQLQKFKEEIDTQARMLRNLSTAYLPTNTAWQRYNAKASAVENSGILVSAIILSGTGTLEDRVNVSRSVIIDLKAQVDSIIARIMEQEQEALEDAQNHRLVLADGESTGYALALDVLRKEFFSK